MKNKNTLNISIGERVRSTRELMSLSREHFAELCDISSSFLSDVERGKKSMTIKTLRKICNVGNVSPNYIVLGISENNSDMDTIIDMLGQLDNQYMPYITDIIKAYLSTVNHHNSKTNK